MADQDDEHVFADIGPAPAAKSAARSAPKKEPKKRCKKRPAQAHEADLASPPPKSKPARAQACQTPNFNYVEVEEQLRTLILSRDLKTTSVTQILRRLESTLGLRFSTLDQQTGKDLGQTDPGRGGRGDGERSHAAGGHGVTNGFRLTVCLPGRCNFAGAVPSA